MNEGQLPKHIAVILDGNGRWAKKRFLPRAAGHRAGVSAARELVKNCANRQIKVLSLFAFSSENWRRPPKEVSFLMNLFLKTLQHEVNALHKNNVQMRFIGERSRFSQKLADKITEIEQFTANNSGLILIIAIDYGGQWDICQATRALAREVALGKLNSDDITPELLESKLSFADLPHPDLFIRPSGELRISNFMLWQLAYAELYFTETLWPDFNEQELDKALHHYAKRERRYGHTSEQISA